MENNQTRNMIHMLIDTAMDVTENTPHYVFVSIRNIGGHLSLDVDVRENGFDSEEDYSVSESFQVEKIAGSKRFQRMMDYLDSLV